jgi:hypothetical protein
MARKAELSWRMAHFKTVSGCLGLALAGCLTEVRTSSLSFLGPQQSGAQLASPPREAALKVVRLFEVRGLQLIDQHPTARPGQIVMKLIDSPHAKRYTAGVDEGARYRVGSVYYVWITPVPSGGGSELRLVGKATVDGAEPCSGDTPQLPCSPVRVDPGLDREVSGRAEARTIEGLLAELALEGSISGPLAPSPEPSAPPAPSPEPSAPSEVLDCRTRRHRIFLEAGQLADIQARARLVKTAPECP